MGSTLRAALVLCLGSLSASFGLATEDPDREVGRPVEVVPGW